MELFNCLTVRSAVHSTILGVAIFGLLDLLACPGAIASDFKLDSPLNAHNALPSFPEIPGLPGYPYSPVKKNRAEGTSVSEVFKNAAGSRRYQIFVPKNLPENPGVLVVLHGCLLTGDQMATGTELNRHANEAGFLVVYPEQSYQDNAWKCWNWFKPENQKRDDGEISIIAGLTLQVIAKYKANTDKVVVTGISAGGAMAANLLGCYSDIYKGGLLESGLEFAAAQTESDAHNVSKKGPTRDLDASAEQALSCSPKRQSLMPVVVVHGKADQFVNPVNGDRTVSLFEKINTRIFVENGGQESQIQHSQTKIAASGKKYEANVTDISYDGKVVIKKVMVEKMGHGWSGGNSAAPYMEPNGVDASQLIVETFFAK